jgi:hypothetical protein
MHHYPVSTQINHVANDDAECLLGQRLSKHNQVCSPEYAKTSSQKEERSAAALLLIALCTASICRSSKRETPFTPPPHASYWLLLELDPATFAVSAE